MPREDMATLHDTYAALQRAQLEREKELKTTERQAASKVVDRYAERNGWDEQDMAEVKGALGLEERSK
jgi:hypothetical protein